MDKTVAKVVVVTGASSGIGEAISKHLAGRDVYLVLGARREAELSRVEGEVKAENKDAVVRWQVCDVTKPEDVSALVELAMNEFGRIDCFVSNAGLAWVEPMEHVRLDHWNEMIDVNIRGVLHGIAATLPIFLAQEGKTGHFITILSTSGIKTVANQAVYAGSKNCVRTILESFRQESQGRFKVTEISPGMVKTSFGGQMDPSIVAATRARMDDIGISPAAVARAVAYALEQPDDVDVGTIVIRPTKQD